MASKLTAFVGVTTPVEDLAVAIQNQGWQLGQVKWDNKLNGYAAEALSPHGDRVSKSGPDPATAVANTLLAVTRRNHMRTTAQYKVGMWRTNWHERQKEIAEAYRDAPIYDPKAVAAWKALGDDSVHRLAVLAGQLHIEPTNEPHPYATADDMRKDVHEKRHYYLSQAGTAHPVWTRDQVAAFRAVHDILGHGVAGGHYDWPGRNLAAAAHAPLLDKLAQQALFAETVGRQAFLQTYGHGPHKVALFPEFVEHHQSENNAPAHQGIHPSQVTAPVASPQPFANLAKLAGETRNQLMQRAKNLPEDRSEVVHQWPDGWSVRRLNDYGDLHREGELMNNCFSAVPASGAEAHPAWEYSPIDHDYPEDYEIFDAAKAPLAGYYAERPFYSLRDPYNLPHVSIDMGASMPGEPGRALGRHNSPIKEPYAHKLGEWADREDHKDLLSELGDHIGEDWDNGYPYQKTAGLSNTIDANKGWTSGVDPLPYNAYIHHGDPMEAKAVMDNAKLIDTGWAQFQKGDGSDDRERMKLAIVNAFRVVLLSPRKDLRWNAIHYQDIAHIPGGVDDPKVYWDTLENSRRSWNEKQGIDPEAHMVYYKFLKPFEARIAAQHPEKGWEWAKKEARQVLFNWWTEEQERISEDDAKKPSDKQRGADEIERRANEALARRLQLFLKPKDDKLDVQDEQLSMLGADMSKEESDALLQELIRAGEMRRTQPRQKTPYEIELDRKRQEERDLYKRDPQAYYEKMWGGHGDVDHPFYGQFIEWVPTQHVLPYAEWKRNPAHGAPTGESATQDYWDILKDNILRNGIKNPIHLYAHPDGTGHVGEGNHRLAVADALGMTHVPVTVVPSKRRGNVQVPLPRYVHDKHAEMLTPSQVGFPVQKTAAKEDVRAKPQKCKECKNPAVKSLVWAEGMAYVPVCAAHEQSMRAHLKKEDGEGAFQEVTIKQAAGGQYNLLTGQEGLKYGAFMGTHLKAIAQISQHSDEILDAALEDVREHDGEGHHFRHAVLALGVSGVGPKVCSFAWLLLQPMTSQLATIDTHMMDVLGHHYEKEMNNRDYFKFEREFRAGLDAAGYGHVPLGAGQWGMWDYKRTGPGSHQDHSAMRVLDPKPHPEIDWVGKAVNLKGESWHSQAPDWWQNTQPARDQVAQEWDDTYGKTFAQNAIPYQDLGTTASRRLSYDHDFDYYWDRSMPVGASLDSKARTLAEHAKAAKLSEDEYEDWLDDHKKDTRLSDDAFRRFKKNSLRKFDRLSKVAGDGPVPAFTHPETQERHEGMPGQSMMEHARLQTGLSTQEIWRLLADEHVQKV